MHFAIRSSAIIHIFLFCSFKAPKCWTVFCNSLYSSNVTQNMNQRSHTFTALFPSHLIKLMSVNRNQMAKKKLCFLVDKFFSNWWTLKCNLLISPPHTHTHSLYFELDLSLGLYFLINPNKSESSYNKGQLT